VEVYRFDDDAYRTLGAAGIRWQDAVHVLHEARPRVRHHMGAVLRVAAEMPDGRWLAIALIEEGDDEYLVVGGRWLDDDEAATLSKITERGQR
jgi:hypothetical protein